MTHLFIQLAQSVTGAVITIVSIAPGCSNNRLSDSHGSMQNQFTNQ